LGFGIPLNTTGGPHFSDVSPTDIFYPYIETAYHNGIITGYNTNPPCSSGTPCFKPNNPVTRGQLTKIIVLAASWQLANPTGNTFQDVEAGSPFYQYVETAVRHGIVGGYECGTPPAGPCVPPENKPYFLPANNATRAQISKIE